MPKNLNEIVRPISAGRKELRRNSTFFGKIRRTESRGREMGGVSQLRKKAVFNTT